MSYASTSGRVQTAWRTLNIEQAIETLSESSIRTWDVNIVEFLVQRIKSSSGTNSCNGQIAHQPIQFNVVVLARRLTDFSRNCYFTDIRCREALSDNDVAWPSMSCFADWSKRRHVTLSIIISSPLHGHPGWHYNVTPGDVTWRSLKANLRYILHCFCLVCFFGVLL